MYVEVGQNNTIVQQQLSIARCGVLPLFLGAVPHFALRGAQARPNYYHNSLGDEHGVSGTTTCAVEVANYFVWAAEKKRP